MRLSKSGEPNNASGRCVVWPEKKLYGSIYGDHSRMRLMLDAAGYTRGSMNGARIRRIPDGRGFIMPYVDDGDDAHDDGEYLILGGGALSTSNTEGVTDEGWICPNCGDREDEDDSSYIEDVEESWCSYCASNNATFCNASEIYLSDRHNSFIEVMTFTTYWDGRARAAPETICVDNADDYGADEIVDEDGDGTGEWVRTDDFAPLMEAICALALHFAGPDDQLALNLAA